MEQGVRILAQLCVPDRQLHLSEPHLPYLENVFWTRFTDGESEADI